MQEVESAGKEERDVCRVQSGLHGLCIDSREDERDTLPCSRIRSNQTPTHDRLLKRPSRLVWRRVPPPGRGLEARGNSGNTNIFYGLNSVNNVSCMIDNNANLKCSGTVSGAAMEMRHRTSGGQGVLAYAVESTSATLEDFGAATLVGGVANVAIERGFGATIDAARMKYS